jgi:hypothetical protein
MPSFRKAERLDAALRYLRESTMAILAEPLQSWPSTAAVNTRYRTQVLVIPKDFRAVCPRFDSRRLHNNLSYLTLGTVFRFLPTRCPNAHRDRAASRRRGECAETIDVVEDIVRTVSTGSAPDVGSALAFGDSSVNVQDGTPVPYLDAVPSGIVCFPSPNLPGSGAGGATPVAGTPLGGVARN